MMNLAHLFILLVKEECQTVKLLFPGWVLERKPLHALHHVLADIQPEVLYLLLP